MPAVRRVGPGAALVAVPPVRRDRPGMSVPVLPGDIYRRPNRDEIAARVRARQVADQQDQAAEPAPVERCRQCGYLVTAIGHRTSCG